MIIDFLLRSCGTSWSRCAWGLLLLILVSDLYILLRLISFIFLLITLQVDLFYKYLLCFCDLLIIRLLYLVLVTWNIFLFVLLNVSLLLFIRCKSKFKHSCFGIWLRFLFFWIWIHWFKWCFKLLPDSFLFKLLYCFCLLTTTWPWWWVIIVHIANLARTSYLEFFIFTIVCLAWVIIFIECIDWITFIR